MCNSFGENTSNLVEKTYLAIIIQCHERNSKYIPNYIIIMKISCCLLSYRLISCFSQILFPLK